jgi:hypothetical protein
VRDFPFLGDLLSDEGTSSLVPVKEWIGLQEANGEPDLAEFPYFILEQ